MLGVRLLIGLIRSVLFVSFVNVLRKCERCYCFLFGSIGADTKAIHQYTEESAGQQPQVTILEARDICGGATGRNGMFFCCFP
jgi:hypothetical protein